MLRHLLRFDLLLLLLRYDYPSFPSLKFVFQGDFYHSEN
jgi:hypothetical protein